ncbi:putative aminopeptidase 2 [Amphibalanus amphitrite]|uniref:Putative aminopeptidase 2 n=1 Tax=Amphibalanus amphitrite TaxID=1232801 RepID=A0A6A4VPE8_AMPAM|nr:putative aminopeptidase 2 [Amphibalanus amphitrite]
MGLLVSDPLAQFDVLVSVWAPPHLVQQGQFAAQVAVSVLDFYTDYFGLPYQLPKLGQSQTQTPRTSALQMI